MFIAIFREFDGVEKERSGIARHKRIRRQFTHVMKGEFFRDCVVVGTKELSMV